jgi:hypothetical protein
MRHSENEKETFKKKRKKGAQLPKRKENTIIITKKNISPRNIDRPKLIMRKSIILKKNKNKRLKKSLN